MGCKTKFKQNKHYTEGIKWIYFYITYIHIFIIIFNILTVIQFERNPLYLFIKSSPYKLSLYGPMVSVEEQEEWHILRHRWGLEHYSHLKGDIQNPYRPWQTIVQNIFWGLWGVCLILCRNWFPWNTNIFF